MPKILNMCSHCEFPDEFPKSIKCIEESKRKMLNFASEHFSRQCIIGLRIIDSKLRVWLEVQQLSGNTVIYKDLDITEPDIFIEPCVNAEEKFIAAVQNFWSFAFEFEPEPNALSAIVNNERMYIVFIKTGTELLSYWWIDLREFLDEKLEIRYEMIV